jgi:hypothetical protein
MQCETAQMLPSSSDGATWQQMTALAPWSQRVNSVGITFNNQIWIATGFDPLNFADYADAWSSADGQPPPTTHPAPISNRWYSITVFG